MTIRNTTRTGHDAPGPPAGATPGRKRHEKARQQARRDILEAAAGVFASHGYAASTLADLARAAGYAAPSLYRYFASKAEIFQSLVEVLKADLRATFEAPVRGDEPLAGRLEGLLSAQLELSRRHRQVFSFLLSMPPAAPGSAQPAAELRAGAPLYQRLLVDWLRRHVRPGELRAPMADTARVLAATAHAFHHAFILGPEQGLEPAAEALRVVDLVLHGIAAAPTAGAPAARRGAPP